MKTHPISIATLSFLLALSLSACKSDQDKVRDAQNEARQELGEAQANVEKQKAEARREINRAASQGDLEEVEEQKIEATEDIAEAEAELEDAKVEATEEVTEARKDAGEVTGTMQRE